jgi:hypothetical protein
MGNQSFVHFKIVAVFAVKLKCGFGGWKSFGICNGHWWKKFH